MRVLTTRFALGALVFGSMLATADTAEAQLLRGRRARAAAYVDPCCPPTAAVATVGAAYGASVTTGAAYVAPPMAGVVQPAAYSQPMAYPAANVAYVDPCCPQGGMTYGSGVSYPSSAVVRRGLFRRGARGAVYAPTAASYAQPMPAGGIYQAGYPPVHDHGAIPAGGIPAPLPGQLPTRSAEGTTGDTAALESKAVRILDGSFEPADLEVRVGTTVKWTNDGKKPHTVTSDKGDWGSGELTGGQTFTATFTKPGTFGYYCKLHPDMKAKITVK